MRLLTALIVAATLCVAAALGEDKAAPDFAKLFAERNPRTIAMLKAEFPDDLRALLLRIDAISASNQSLMLKLSAGFDAVSGIRRKYAPRLAFAPPEALAALLVSAAGYHEAVLKGEGAGGCGVFAQNGSGTLFQLDKSELYAKEIDLQSALYLEAVAAGIEKPEYYGELTRDDFNELLAVMAKAGVSKDYLTALASGKPSDANLCPALATMFKAAAIVDTPGGLRVRADLAKNLTGY